MVQRFAGALNSIVHVISLILRLGKCFERLTDRCIACNTSTEVWEMLPDVPSLYLKIITFLGQLLHEFSHPSNSAQSKMTSANFAMVFSPR